MTNLILQPAGDEHSRRNYENTIINGVDLNDPEVQKLMTIQERTELEALVPEGKVRLWGAKPGEDNRGRTKWKRIAPGDYVLFHFGYGNASVAQVISKFHNVAFAKHKWGTTLTRNGEVQTWEYIYAVTQPTPLIINVPEFNRSIGRRENANLQEFSVLTPEASAGGRSYLQLAEVSGSQAPSPHWARKPQKRLRAADADKVEELDELDYQVRSTRRLEQQTLRNYLMSEDSCTCALCGRHFPIEFLVAAHIKPRAKCTDREKRDVANVAMPNCKMGCDELFGRGLISVKMDGSIVISSKAPREGPVGAYITTNLKNGHCFDWKARNESHKYFLYHYENEFQA